MDFTPFLEIVVPTYNRASILRCTLNELCAAVSTHSQLLSLRVIDNCSTDETPDVVRVFTRRGLLSSQRNDSNIGLIRNIAKCISTSSAEWVWVFGDDDHILLHCLSLLIRALQSLPRDVVFARALAAKISSNGYLVSAEQLSDTSQTQSVTVYQCGLEIVQHGSIHSLAFISQLLIRPRHWNQNYHDEIYRDSDLYTFVLALLHESIDKRTAAINFHVVAATDRGDRSYYTPNMCVARLSEYTKLEQLVHGSVGTRKARRLLKQGRKGLLVLRIASSLKLIGYSNAYRIAGQDPIAYMLSFQSPYQTDKWMVRFLALLAIMPGMKRCFRFIYDGLFKMRKSEH